MMQKKIAIITTKQNYTWTSMQEVLPALERCWEDAATKSRIINVDVEPLRNHISFLMSCDALIIIAFNETVSRFILNARINLNLQIPLVLHVYGHATLACWPQYRFGTLDCLNEGDAFVGTCLGDLKCMEYSLLNAKTYNIPYPYFPISNAGQRNVGEKVFAYVGRLSDQKNVLQLIHSYNILLEMNSKAPALYIYGSEDFLGWPNLGIASTNCLDDIKKLIAKFNLNEKIFLKGFQPRELIYQTLGSDHIFVSASTHSDENFGMAAMRSLAVGGKAVLSHWGGHQEFKAHCPESVWTTEVIFKNFRPQIIPEEFANCMNEALATDLTPKNILLSDYFFPQKVTDSFQKILNELSFSEKRLQPTELALQIYRQQAQFEQEGNIQKAFSGIDDPLVQRLLGAYR